MKNHGKTVVSLSKNAFTIIDMPYQSYRNNYEALKNAKILLSYSKCQSVKLETDNNTIDIVRYLNKNKIKVISHIGVTPQKYKNFSKIRSVGKKLNDKKKILKLAIDLEKAGSVMIVLECIDEKLSKEISSKLKIPTIGIGASTKCDGQVLVINDILETDNSFKKPKFVKTYVNLKNIIEKAVGRYCADVKNKRFPQKKNTY